MSRDDIYGMFRASAGPQRSTASSAVYNGSATTSTHYQNMNVVLNDANCPYYQLYGPPPSYETVIAQTRGKVASPASPSATRLNHDLQTANVIPNPSVPQCFFYACSSPARLVDAGAVDQCHQDESANEGVPPFAHYSQYCAANGAAIGRNVCVPLEYPEESSAGMSSAGSGNGFDYPTSPQHPSTVCLMDASDVGDAEGHATLNVDAATGGYSASWCPDANDQSALKVHGRPVVVQDGRCSAMPAVAAHSSPKRTEASGSLDSDAKRKGGSFSLKPLVPEDATRKSFPRKRTNYGGSLRLPRRNTTGAIVHRGDGFHRISLRDSSSSQRRVLDSASPPGRAAHAGASPSQSNPSNNVILGSFIFGSARSPARENAGQARDSAMDRSTNLDSESKHKLDRSKSLD